MRSAGALLIKCSLPEKTSLKEQKKKVCDGGGQRRHKPEVEFNSENEFTVSNWMNYVLVSTNVRSNANISKEINPEMGLRLNSGNKDHIVFFTCSQTSVYDFHKLRVSCIVFMLMDQYYFICYIHHRSISETANK